MVLTHPHVAAAGVGVQVVRVDVEGDEADGREGRRVDDGHVVGGADADGGHIGAGTGAHVGDAILEGGWGEKENYCHYCPASVSVRRVLLSRETLR